MKTFLKKLGSSLQLDSAWDGARHQSILDNGFGLLDGRLRETRPLEKNNPNLHSSIMKAIRAERRKSDLSQPRILRWATVCGGGLVLTLSVWWLVSRLPGDSGQLHSEEVRPMVAMALDQGRELTQRAPDIALAPLVGEMELLNRDVQSAMNLLVATMP